MGILILCEILNNFWSKYYYYYHISSMRQIRLMEFKGHVLGQKLVTARVGLGLRFSESVLQVFTTRSLCYKY